MRKFLFQSEMGELRERLEDVSFNVLSFLSHALDTSATVNFNNVDIITHTVIKVAK